MDKCYRCDEVISMCPCDESTYTADDEISRLPADPVRLYETGEA